MNKYITANELFMALLYRHPTQWETTYWNEQLKNTGFSNVFRRLADCDEHNSFKKDRQQMFVPAGHFYSPIVDQQFVSARKDAIYSQAPTLSDIDINNDKQLSFLSDIINACDRFQFSEQKTEPYRYYYENNAFGCGDALIYATMLFKYRPKRIVEVGSGFTSALVLDVIDQIEGYDPEILFIDPYPQLAKEIANSSKGTRINITEAFIQDINPSTFDNLESGDFYFMDTTHIVKTGSDVLYHIEKVLPRLKSGVILHMHDIFFPFEYPPTWVFDMKLSWNELYYLRAFMAHNHDYEIMYFADYMRKIHAHKVLSVSPLFEKNGGASFWFNKR
jgi:hypothetical protein